MRLGGAVARDSLIYLAGFGGVALVRFAVVPIYTRALGVTDYADWALVIAMTTCLAAVAILGGDVTLSRFWFRAIEGPDRRSLTATWIAFLTTWSVVVAVVAMGVAWLWGEQFWERTGVVGLLLVGFATLIPAQLGRMLAQILRNQFNPVGYSLLTFGTVAAGVGLGLLFLLAADLGVRGILLGTLCGEVLGCVVGLLLTFPALRGRWDPRRLPTLLRFAVPLVPGTVAMWVFVGADRLVIEEALGPAGLGPYSVAATLVLPISMLMYGVGQAWLPRVTAEYERDAAAGLSLTGVAMEVALTLYGMVAVVLGAIAPWFVVLVAGENFAEGARAVPLLALGASFLGTALFSSTGFTLARRTGLAMVVPVVASLVTVGLLLLFVPPLGMVGGALSVASGYFLLTVGYLIVSLRYVRVHLSWARLAATSVGLASVAVVNTVWQGSAAAIAASTLAMVGLVVALGRRLRHLRQPLHTGKSARSASPTTP